MSGDPADEVLGRLRIVPLLMKEDATVRLQKLALADAAMLGVVGH